MAGITRMFDRPPMGLKGGMEASADGMKNRPETETHLTRRPDRVAPYLIHRMDEFTFDEFTEDFLKRGKMTELFEGVPIPLRDEDREAFKSSTGVPSTVLAENMARVLGIDPKFRYADVYKEYIEFNFGKKGVDNMTRKAKDFCDMKQFEDALIYFRAGLVLKYNDLAAMYGYARLLRALYQDSDKEDYIGYLKAESLDYFEMTTEVYRRFDMGFYYLGYMYLNLGLYTKAMLAWEEFLKLSRIFKDRQEIKKRLKQLEDPVEIERGYNSVLAGRWKKGISILEPYKDSKFNDWWPLWYYLGVAYARTNRLGEAESAFKQALKGSPRHAESMQELADIYKAKGDKTNQKKYQSKLKLVTKD